MEHGRIRSRRSGGSHWSVEPGSKNLGFRITELWAFVADADDGDEGLIAMQTPNGWVPMVCADRQRIDQMRTYAVEVARQTNQTVRLIHFGGERTELEVYPGRG